MCQGRGRMFFFLVIYSYFREKKWEWIFLAHRWSVCVSCVEMCERCECVAYADQLIYALLIGLCEVEDIEKVHAPPVQRILKQNILVYARRRNVFIDLRKKSNLFGQRSFLFDVLDFYDFFLPIKEFCHFWQRMEKFPTVQLHLSDYRRISSSLGYFWTRYDIIRLRRRRHALADADNFIDNTFNDVILFLEALRDSKMMMELSVANVMLISRITSLKVFFFFFYFNDFLFYLKRSIAMISSIDFWITKRIISALYIVSFYNERILVNLNLISCFIYISWCEKRFLVDEKILSYFIIE